MREAITVPLEVSTVDSALAAPLGTHACTQFLSRLDEEVGNPHVLLRSPNMSKKPPASISNQQ